jgi:hypothetical protein
MQDNKLFIRGIAPSQEAANKAWDQAKLINPNLDDITLELQGVSQSPAQGAVAAGVRARSRARPTRSSPATRSQRSASNSTEMRMNTFVVILIWVSYSAQILFFGAEFTQVYADRFGSRIKPAKDARPVTEKRPAQDGARKKKR